MTNERKLNREDFELLFGDVIPIEAIALVWTAPPETPLSEIRARLVALADQRRRQAADREGRP